MLSQIRVSNIALMDEVSVDLGEGLNILTGETGAGKSILIGAINLALSAKSSRDVVRDETKPASVELYFSDVSASVKALLEEMDLPCEENDCLITRYFGTNGKGVSRINGAIVMATQVKQVAAALIDIHGQHEHQSLLNTATHIDLLDKFSAGLRERRTQMAEVYAALKETEKELAEYSVDEEELARRLNILQFESREIEEADLVEGEEDELNDLRKRLIYSGRLRDGALKAHELLRSYDGEGSALDLLGQVASMNDDLARIDAEFFTDKGEALRDCISILEDLASEYRDYGENIDEDEERLREIEERLDLIDKMKKKYGRTIDLIYAYKDKVDAEIAKWENASENAERLQREYDAKKAQALALCAELTALRKETAVRIGGEITELLTTLQFSDPLFEVRVEPQENFTAKGADSVTFMVRTNVGEEVKPLKQVASGGEVSRIMLAIKTVLASQDEIDSLIFDEIDTGISGRTAQSVAEKMSLIARFRQVIAITHLPQLAAMADTHLRIVKIEEEGRAHTEVEELPEARQIDEIARLLGGRELTETVYANAREMKSMADSWKKSVRV